MKLQNVKTSIYATPQLTTKGVNKNIIKPIQMSLEPPVKKSGKTIGGIIMSGLAAIGLVAEKKEEEQKEFTAEEFEVIKNKFYKNTPEGETDCINDCYLTKNNIPIFRWLLKNWDDYIGHSIYREHKWLMYVRKLFYATDIPHEHISKIMLRWDTYCDEPEKSIETYRTNREKIKELTPFVNKYSPQNKDELKAKNTVKRYLELKPYRQNLSYMTPELIERFIKEYPHSLGLNYSLDILFARNEEQFNLRLDFIKFLSQLPQKIDWKTHNFLSMKEYQYDEPNWKVFEYINKDNAKFIKELIKGGKYSIEQIKDIALYTDKDTLETMKVIFNDERIKEEAKSDILWRDIDNALMDINKDNAKRILDLFNMSKDKKLILPSLNDLVHTTELTMKLCKTYKINPLLVTGENYITPESAPVVKKITNNEKYNDNYWTMRDLAKMAAQNREAKDLLEALVDKKCELKDIKDIYRSVFDIRGNSLEIGAYRHAQKGKFPAILKIAANKDLTSSQTEYLLNECNERPVDFLAKHLENKTVDLKYINKYWRFINQDNMGLVSKLLRNKKFNQMYLADILNNYQPGSIGDVISIVESGKFDENPELAKFATASWSYILDNNLKFDEIDNDSILDIAKTKNPRLFYQYKQLKRDVYQNRNLLKPGLEDLTDADLDGYIYDNATILTLNRVGKGVLESIFPETIYGLEEFCEDISCMDLPEDLYEKLMLKIYPENSKRYIDIEAEIKEIKTKIKELSGEDLLNKKEQIEVKARPILNEIKELKIELSNLADNDERKIQIKKRINNDTKLINSYKYEINSLYKNSENYLEINNLMKEVYEKQSEMKNIVAGKVNLPPQKIADKVRVIAQSTDLSEVILNDLINLLQADIPENEEKWNEYINKLIYSFTEIGYDKSLSEKLDLIHSKYLSKLFISGQDFFDALEELMHYVKNDINLPIEEIIDNLPQNIETRRLFEELGIDYEKWTKVDKNSYTRVKVKLDAAEAKRSTIENLEEDLNDEMFSKIPQEQKLAIYSKIKEAGFEIRQDKKVIYDEFGLNIGQKEFYHIYKNEKTIQFEDLGKIIDSIKEQINSDEFWFRENEDKQVEKAKEHFYYHFMKMRVPEFENANNMKDGEVVDIEVHKTDMYDIKKALCLGNDAGCCTALGANSNEWTAPNYIMNKCIGAIELMDRGNFAGNTMIYLAKVDGELSLVLDNIEMKAKYQFNNAIRDAFFEYARKLCTEIGKPNMPIYAGPNRHKVDMTDFEIKEREMFIVGDSGKQEVYLDFDANPHIINQKYKYKLDLYKIS